MSPGAQPAHSVAAVMVHVADVAEAIDWYKRAFPEATRRGVDGTDFEYLDVGGVQLELVPSDEKVGSGPCGSVVYWEVPQLGEAIDRVLSLGALLYRGPLAIEDGRSMCQVQDPWGNCIGLRGPA